MGLLQWRMLAIRPRKQNARKANGLPGWIDLSFALGHRSLPTDMMPSVRLMKGDRPEMETVLPVSVNLLKEVIQPQLPLRLPCYDFTPVIDPTFGRCFPRVSSRTSGVTDFHGVTGGVYKARVRIQRGMLIHVY